jgi:hypothetical protein
MCFEIGISFFLLVPCVTHRNRVKGSFSLLALTHGADVRRDFEFCFRFGSQGDMRDRFQFKYILFIKNFGQSFGPASEI